MGFDPKRFDWNPQIMSKVQDMPNSTPEKIGHLWQTRRARVGKKKKFETPQILFLGEVFIAFAVAIVVA